MGDYLLFLNNTVLGIFFLPTLLKKDSKVHPLTAVVYVVMITIGAAGYFLNGQWLPGIPTAIGALLWLVMLWKSRQPRQRLCPSRHLRMVTSLGVEYREWHGCVREVGHTGPHWSEDIRWPNETSA